MYFTIHHRGNVKMNNYWANGGQLHGIILPAPWCDTITSSAAFLNHIADKRISAKLFCPHRQFFYYCYLFFVRRVYWVYRLLEVVRYSYSHAKKKKNSEQIWRAANLLIILTRSKGGTRCCSINDYLHIKGTTVSRWNHSLAFLRRWKYTNQNLTNMVSISIWKIILVKCETLTLSDWCELHKIEVEKTLIQCPNTWI